MMDFLLLWVASVDGSWAGQVGSYNVAVHHGNSKLVDVFYIHYWRVELPGYSWTECVSWGLDQIRSRLEKTIILSRMTCENSLYKVACWCLRIISSFYCSFSDSIPFQGNDWFYLYSYLFIYTLLFHINICEASCISKGLCHHQLLLLSLLSIS